MLRLPLLMTLATLLAVTATVPVGSVPVSTGNFTTRTLDTNCLAPPNGLVGRWAANGNVRDEVRMLHGALVNGATFAAGIAGEAFSFDGVDDYAELRDGATWDLHLHDFTIGLWVQMDELKNSMFIHQQSGESYGGFEFDFWAGAQLLLFTRDAANILIIKPWQPQAGQWYHLAVTRSAGVTTLYVDGVPLGSEFDPNPISDVSGVVRLGNWSGGGFDMRGQIDEVAVFHRALSAGEIQLVSGFQGPLCAVEPSNDITEPELAVPGSFVREAASPFGAVVGYSATAMDGVDGAIAASCSPLSGSEFHLGETVVTCSATDAAGNSAHATFSVTVVDTTPPAISAPPSVTAFLKNSDPDAVVTFDVSASDVVDGSVPVSCNPPSESVFPFGSTPVTCIAADAAGNTATRTFTVTVADLDANCQVPPNQLMGRWAANGNVRDEVGTLHGTLVNGATFSAGSSGEAFNFDGVDDYVQLPDGATWGFGADDFTIGLWVRMDELKNSVFIHQQSGESYGGFELDFWAGAQLLLFTRDAANILIIKPWQPQAGQWYHLAVTRSAGVTTLYVDGVPLGSEFDPNPISDVSGVVRLGNWSGGGFDMRGQIDEVAVFHRALSAGEIQLVSGFQGPLCAVDPSRDTTPPSITAPSFVDTDVKGTAVEEVAVFDVHAADLVDGSVPVSCSPPSGSAFPLGSTIVTCSATDASGNISIASITVRVRERIPPTIEIHAPPMPVEATSEDGAEVTFSVTTTDNVPGVVDVRCDHPFTDLYGFGGKKPTEITCTATDASGNSTTSSLFVTVVDTTPPAFATSPDISLEAQGSAGAPVTFTPPQAVDRVSSLLPVSCSTAEAAVFETEGETELFPIGSTTVTCVAQDFFGNVAADEFVITVVDSLPPVLLLSDQQAVGTEPEGLAIDFTAVATDIVDGAIEAVCSPTSGTTFAIGTTVVTCTASDEAGNGVSTSFNVVILDGVPPAFEAVSGQVLEATSPDGTAATFDVHVTDNIDEIVTPVCAPQSGSVFPLGVNAVTCSATDAAGNAASVTFEVTVRDTTPPKMPLHEIVAIAATGNATTVTYDVQAIDIVDGSITPACTPASGFRFPIGRNTVTCVATDAAGNTITSTFSVFVNDGEAPVLTVPRDYTLEATSPAGAVSIFAATARDNVDPMLSVQCTPASGSTFPLGTTQVTCQSTDSSRNTGAQNFRITVVDTTPPALTLPGDISAAAETSAGVAVSFLAAAIDIVDGGRTVTCSPVSGSTFAPGDTTVSCSTSDSRGNSATGTFVVTVSTAENRIARFVAFSTEQTWLRSKATVLSGDVGANTSMAGPQGRRDADDDGERDHTVEVRIGEHVKMMQVGSRLIGDTVWLRANASVYDVQSNELINRRAAILGTAASPIALPYLAMPAFPAITPGTTPITVAERATLTLPAGRYGKVRVRKGATLVINGGIYEMLSLDLDQQATVILRAATELRIATELDTESKSKMILDQSVSGLSAAQIIIYVAGGDTDCAHDGQGPDGDNAGKTVVHIGEQNVIQANVYAPNGSVWLKARTLATGAFVGKRVRIGEKVELSLANGLR